MKFSRLYRPSAFLPLWLRGFLLMLVFTGTTLLGYAKYPKENIELLDSVARLCTDSLIHDIHAAPPHTITLSQHPAAERLQHMIARHTTLPVQITSSAITNQSSAVLHVFVGDYAIRYYLHTGDTDSLVREARLWLAAMATATTGSHQHHPQYTASLRDTIARSDIPFVESRQYAYARAPVPDTPPGLYSDVVEPLLIISSAIITTILLFTVRSQ